MDWGLGTRGYGLQSMEWWLGTGDCVVVAWLHLFKRFKQCIGASQDKKARCQVHGAPVENHCKITVGELPSGARRSSSNPPPLLQPAHVSSLCLQSLSISHQYCSVQVLVPIPTLVLTTSRHSPAIYLCKGIRGTGESPRTQRCGRAGGAG